MNRSTPYFFRSDDRSIGSAWLIAILFAALATISFALDQSLTLSPIAPPAAHLAR